MNEKQKRVVAKIVKRLRSPDDNDKLAALTYLTKLFKTPAEFLQSQDAKAIWESLRATHFLERALHTTETANLVCMILSTFCHVCEFKDMVTFLPKLIELSNEGFQDAITTLVDVLQSADDISPFFEYLSITDQSLELLSKCLSSVKGCSATPAVFRARNTILSMVTGREDLSLRTHLFLIVSRLFKANDALAVMKARNTIDLAGFLAVERLAFIELRLQLDIPMDYKETEKKTSQIEFTQKIGPLLNQDLAAASCEVLEILLRPLLNHEEELSDTDIDQYFDTVNTLIKDSVAIFCAAEGPRDKDRVELRCLISIFGMWLMEAPFLCHNNDFLRSLTDIVRLLCYFPKEALHFIPAFSQLHESKDVSVNLDELITCMKPHATPAELELMNVL